MSKIVFSSVIHSIYYDELEKLMFFNPQQWKVRNEVISAVERYGQPKIYRDTNWGRLCPNGAGIICPR